MLCPDCGKEFPKKGIATHRWRKHGEGTSHKPTPLGRPAWNKGLTKSDDRVRKQAESLSSTLQEKVENGTYVQIPLSPDHLERLSRRMTEQNPGGRCSWFLVGEEQVQGSWERDLAQKMSSLGVQWVKRVARGNFSWFFVDDNGSRRRYTPDFFLPELNLQLELKGFWWGNDRRKMELVQSQNKTRIRIVESNLYEVLLVTGTKDEFHDHVADGVLAPV